MQDTDDFWVLVFAGLGVVLTAVFLVMISRFLKQLKKEDENK